MSPKGDKDKKAQIKSDQKQKELENQNSGNLRKMVMVNEANHMKTSKLVLNQNALKFKLNIEKALYDSVKSASQNTSNDK